MTPKSKKKKFVKKITIDNMTAPEEQNICALIVQIYNGTMIQWCNDTMVR